MLTRIVLAAAGFFVLLSFDATAQNAVGGGGDRNFQVQVTTLLRETEKQMNALTDKVRRLEDQVAALSQDVADARKASAAEKGANERLEGEIAKLRSNLDETNRGVKKSMEEMVSKVRKETDAAMSGAVSQINQKLTAAQTAQQAAIAQANKAIAQANANATAKAAADAQSTDEFVEYTVQQGATIAAISKAYKVSVDEIRKANNLKDDNIRVGQKLLIPKK